MRLADFILTNREPILAEWEAFARTCVPAGGPPDPCGAALEGTSGGAASIPAPGSAT
jgi:hypothetical protein